MNKVVLIGRLTRNPEQRTSVSGVPITNITLAVNRNFKNKDGEYEADFINIVAFNKLAEIIANNLTKGRQLAVSGRIQTRNYEDKDGQKRYITEVVADDVQFLDKKNKGTQAAPSAADNNTGFGNNEDFFPLDDAPDDMPF